MNSTENQSNPQLACFKLDDYKFFHTGEFSNHVVPENHIEMDIQNYCHIRFHMFVKIQGQELYLLQRTPSENDLDLSSSFTCLIEFTKSFSYEYMESYVKKKFANTYGGPIENVRFYKMELRKRQKKPNELVYSLLGTVRPPVNEISQNFFSLATKKEIITQSNQIYSQWRKIFGSSIKFPPIHEELPQNSIIGLIIGRFQPVHLGHVYLFQKALETVDFLKIGVGSSQRKNEPNNPFSFKNRKRFIEHACKEVNIPPSSYEIYPIPDQYDFEKWKASIFEIVQDFDVIISNNLWIGRLIEQQGKILIFGLKHNFTTYNGSNIRELLRKNNPEWKNLVPKSIIPYIEVWMQK
ncbi:MAG: adenylyltransferase/cytidyltransferase family protein [Candidatus Lokiarchaeota archaeon]|nr:adenylyltransferase/cytidyltransferase family protein [Candidatus Lokiarchaeota archaeon]